MREHDIDNDLIDLGAVTVETKGGGDQLPLDSDQERRIAVGLSAD